MDISQVIRLEYPLPIAKLYEAMCLENEPRQRVRRQVALFERTCQYLVLAGLACYNHRALSDSKVEAARQYLGRPSLGHWVSTLRALSRALGPHEPDFLTANPSRVYRNDALSGAVEAISQTIGSDMPKKLRLHHFLDAVVEFRNKKIGHGLLSLREARAVSPCLEAGLTQWLGDIGFLRERDLIYIAQVRYETSQYICVGTRLSSGTSLTPAKLSRENPVEPRRVYLCCPKSDELYALHPFFHYDEYTQLLYLYAGLSAQERLTLRCPYDAPGAETEYTESLDKTYVLGTAGVEDAAQDEARPEKPSPAEATTYVKDALPMRNWFDIIPPHEDIRKGGFDEAIFAADLGDVVAGTAATDYGDPYAFYKKTYLTQGLRNLLTHVNRKLQDGRGASVVEIQTPFGGGKTHALLAIYHYLRHGATVQELLPPGLDLLNPRVCVITGNHWNPIEGRTTDGVQRCTFWGELAYQIGGAEGYELFRQNDEARISPGKEKLRTFLEAHQPFVLLFDEILEYVNRAQDVREQLAVSLGTQTFSFFQELSEAVATLRRGMLAVTLPSSFLEDFGERREESLARLSKIFGRVESIETPVQGEEVYAVIRRRLFDVEHLKRAPMREVVHQYIQTYQQHKDELPPKARDVSFREKMELAYPFHPDVIDILYEKWSTFSSFQRTRGVLRLLANVIEDLYQREMNIDLIMPGDINFDCPPIRREFLRHVGPEYEGIIGSDIAGHDAKAPSLDTANRSWKHLAQRVATAVFFHSFSADDSTPGINLPYIKLAVMRSETIPSMVTEILQRLSNTLWYLNTHGDACYFSRIPNLNRMILDKKEFYNESYRLRLREVIQGEIGKEFTTYLWPTDGDAIPDNRALKLIILPPEDNGADIPQWIERRGLSFREYQNTLFFALADVSAFAQLREDVKTYLALEEIEEQVKAGTSPLPEEKLDEVRRRKRAIDRDFSWKVRRMYHTLRVGSQEIDLGQPVAGSETLSHWYWRELTSGERGLIVTQLHYRMLVNKFMAQNNQVPSAVILGQFYKNPTLPAPSEQGVVARAIQLGVKDGALGLADLRDSRVARDSFRYEINIPLGDVTFGEGEALLSKAQCEALLARWAEEDQAKMPTPEPEPRGGEEPGGRGGGGEPGTGPESPEPPTPPEEKECYHRLRLVISGVPASRIADVNRGIFIPLSNVVDGSLTFTLELDVTSQEGITQDTLENKIKETVRQIGAEVREERSE